MSTDKELRGKLTELDEKKLIRKKETIREDSYSTITYRYQEIVGELWKRDNSINIELNHQCDNWVIGNIEETWDHIKDLCYIMELLEKEKHDRQ